MSKVNNNMSKANNKDTRTTSKDFLVFLLSTFWETKSE